MLPQPPCSKTSTVGLLWCGVSTLLALNQCLETRAILRGTSRYAPDPGPCFTLCLACLQDWATLLRACGWQGSSDRLAELCEMLVSNDVRNWFQLGRCGDPGTWPGAQRFLASELQLLRTLRTNGAQEPRHVQHTECVAANFCSVFCRSPAPKKPRLAQGLQGGDLESIDRALPDSQTSCSPAGPRNALKLLTSHLGSVEEPALCQSAQPATVPACSLRKLLLASHMRPFPKNSPLRLLPPNARPRSVASPYLLTTSF